MANEIENALKTAAASVAKYVKDAATLQVETSYVVVGSAEAATLEPTGLVARSIIRLDGDCEITVPLQKNDAGVLEVDSALFDLHQQNVQTAIEYRSRILNALLTTLNPR